MGNEQTQQRNSKLEFDKASRFDSLKNGTGERKIQAFLNSENAASVRNMIRDNWDPFFSFVLDSVFDATITRTINTPIEKITLLSNFTELGIFNSTKLLQARIDWPVNEKLLLNFLCEMGLYEDLSQLLLIYSQLKTDTTTSVIYDYLTMVSNLYVEHMKMNAAMYFIHCEHSRYYNLAWSGMTYEEINEKNKKITNEKIRAWANIFKPSIMSNSDVVRAIAGQTLN